GVGRRPVRALRRPPSTARASVPPRCSTYGALSYSNWACRLGGEEVLGSCIPKRRSRRTLTLFWSSTPNQWLGDMLGTPEENSGTVHRPLVGGWARHVHGFSPRLFHLVTVVDSSISSTWYLWQLCHAGRPPCGAGLGGSAPSPRPTVGQESRWHPFLAYRKSAGAQEAV